MGSVIGALPPPDSVKEVCNPAALEELLLMVVLGRLRKARHALQFRHRGSSDVFIACKYSSSPFLRSSVNVGFDVVFENQDFWGRRAGGATPTWEVISSWRALKSEYRFCTVKERRGSRRAMLYKV